MREVHEKKWSDLSPIWHEFYQKNQKATPYQSYEFLTFTKRGKPYRNDLFRLLGVREWNLVLYRDENPVAIAPLLIKKQRGKYKVVLRGHFTAANQLDFIYDDISYDDFKFLMDYIKSKLGRVSFLLDRISEKTVTCEYLKKYFSLDCIDEEECYAIPIATDYDEWLKGLSRSARGNLSTYCNRLEREGLEWSVDVYCGRRIDKKLYRKMMYVYVDRFVEKNGINLGIFRRPVACLLQAFLMCDRLTRWMSREADSFHAVLSIGPDVAAFASGVCCRGGRIIVSRLSISTAQSRYGPGGILISSILRYIIAQNKSGAMDIKELDLSQGGHGGMSYKQTYGGQVHYCYVFHN